VHLPDARRGSDVQPHIIRSFVHLEGTTPGPFLGLLPEISHPDGLVRCPKDAPRCIASCSLSVRQFGFGARGGRHALQHASRQSSCHGSLSHGVIARLRARLEDDRGTRNSGIIDEDRPRNSIHVENRATSRKQHDLLRLSFQRVRPLYSNDHASACPIIRNTWLARS